MVHDENDDKVETKAVRYGAGACSVLTVTVDDVNSWQPVLRRIT